MTSLTALWLPILLSAVAVFIASSIINVLLPWHKNDFARLADEDRAMDALRPFVPGPGDYMLPRCEGPKQMQDPAFVEKLNKGPVVALTVFPNGQFNMGKMLGQWFVYTLVIGLFAAYLAGRTLPAGSAYLSVFRVVGTAAFMGYSLALVQVSIWYGRRWSTTGKSLIDGLVYALITAGMFGWLWPTA